MATEYRRPVSAIESHLRDEPQRFDFFQAVRLLHRLAKLPQGERGQADVPDRPVGHDDNPTQELIRFRASQSLSFAGSEVEAFEPAEPGHQDAGTNSTQATMHVRFMGLTGCAGVLPPHYTAQVLRDARSESRALVDFLDLFNHRLISLFYRAWEKYRRTAQIESNVDIFSPGDDFSHAVASLAGLGTKSVRSRMAVPDIEAMFHVGHMSQRPANAASLQQLVMAYLQRPARVIQFVGCWLLLSPEVQTQLSQTDVGLGSQLGRGAVAGSRVWDIQSKFRLRLGPLELATFRQLMPGSHRLLALVQLVRTYVGVEKRFDVQLVLKANEVPWCQLGDARLGWDTWVRNSAFADDVDDPVFELLAV